MEQIAQCTSAAITYVTEKFDLQTDYRRLLGFVPLGKMDPGLIYLCWLKSCGGNICDWAINHAKSLRYEPLSASQFLEHRQRIRHLDRLEQRRKSFAHYVMKESQDDDCTALVNAARANNGSLQITIGDVGSKSLCTTMSRSKLGADSEVGDGAQKRLDEDEWMLVFSMEPPPETTEEALAAAELFTGGMGLAM